jgi:tetratricopeptide (TPR) repeat protein
MSLCSTGCRIGIGWNAAGILALGLTAGSWKASPAFAQESPPAAKGEAKDGKSVPRPDRKKAMALASEHRDLEALPLLEELARADPRDREVQERLAVALITRSVTVGPKEGQELRRRARSIFLELKKSGPLSDLGAVLADGIPDDGRIPNFSDRAEAQAAMKEGEAAFARRDFEAARRAYQRALSLDPKLYHAALFVGDTYFAANRLPEARTWFSRAILIDPNKETAHRYLGDALNKAGLFAAARLSYIDAIIAEPYARRPWMGLGNWAKANNVTLQHPRVVPEGLDGDAEAGKGAEPKGHPASPLRPDDGRSHWRLYRETRQAWAKERFQKTFPGAAYRHSLAEEADALRQVARAIAADVKAGRIREPDPCFANLFQLDKEGLLEAYILLARPDDGIAEDFEAYRDAHRGELRRYLRKYVAPLGDAERDAENTI